ncbi:MAG: CBS domain-containing protein [Clostridia bacterium]|jgi:CBS domain-containing protein|nr:CBS domain-containing protein [Clostridiaceae bacterium]
MKVRDIMTTSVAQVSPYTTVSEAARLMEKHNVGSVPVCSNDKIVGILTDRDIVVRNIAGGKDPRATKVEEIMSAEVTTVTPDTEVAQVGKIMAEKQIRRIPVTDNDRLVGMVALGDIAVRGMYDAEVAQALAEISIPAKPKYTSE